ncbi:MAG: DUF1614 domain-containing protein [Desulfonatronovibrionaceae bacterium]
MLPNPFFFLPFFLLFFIVLFLLILFVFALIQVGAITIAFAKLGLTGGQVFLLLMGSLLGSMVNIPVYKRPYSGPQESELEMGRIFGHYRIPRYRMESKSAEQVIAVNFGGAFIPVFLSGYFIFQIGPSLGLLLCLLAVGFVTYKMARPVQGVGIGVPFLIPPLVTVLATWIFAPSGQEAQVAYISGSLGTLAGADVLHLINPATMRHLQAPVLSVGGAGTFDGIFLAGILAVLLA